MNLATLTENLYQCGVMLFCRNCQKDVDFNSVVNNKVTGALNLSNPETTIAPTVVNTTSEIVNVCKVCGQRVRTRAEWQQLEIEAIEAEEAQKAGAKVGLIIWVVFFGLISLLVFGSGGENSVIAGVICALFAIGPLLLNSGSDN